jgi:hypothetical protein
MLWPGVTHAPIQYSGRTMRHLTAGLMLLLVATVVALVGPPAPARAATAGPILYVDGKIGHDDQVGVTWTTYWGLSPDHPFKTVKRALDETKHGSPAAIRIKGYNDYVYREKIDRGYRMGSATTPVVISSYTSEELGSATPVRPIIDGGITVGKKGWSRPWPTKYPHVWCKTWRPPGANLLTGQRVPPGYDSTYTSARTDRLYMDGAQPLHRPSTAPSIATLNRRPYTQYWNPNKSTKNLCVHLAVWGGKTSENPAKHSIVVPWYFGIILAGGSSNVTVRDLRIRHTIMGVGISVSKDKSIGKSHDNTVYNVDASYNFRMGFWTAGDHNVFDHISGSRNSLQLVKLDEGNYADGTPYGAQHNVVRYSISTQNLAHGIKLAGRDVRWNEIYGNTILASSIPRLAKSGGGATQGVQIANGASNNTVRNNLIRGGDAGIELYQYDSYGGPLRGNSIHHNVIEHVQTGVFLWDNKVARWFGTGDNTFSYNVYYDTRKAAIGGNGTTSGKLFQHETIRHSGFSPGKSPNIERAAVALMAGSITIQDSIIDDSNGPSICPRVGTTVYLSYSDTYRWRKDTRASMPHGTFCKSTSLHAFGVVEVGANVPHVDPGYVTDPSSSAFLVVKPGSAAYGTASDGGNMGAR